MLEADTFKVVKLYSSIPFGHTISIFLKYNEALSPIQYCHTVGQVYYDLAVT
jgi:hypothetical protein